jgi:hypothetical protein
MSAEEDRALAYRVSAARRRCARLVGSSSAYLALRAGTLALLDIDAAGVPRQGSQIDGGEQEVEDRGCP